MLTPMLAALLDSLEKRPETLEPFQRQILDELRAFDLDPDIRRIIQTRPVFQNLSAKGVSVTPPPDYCAWCGKRI